MRRIIKAQINCSSHCWETSEIILNINKEKVFSKCWKTKKIFSRLKNKYQIYSLCFTWCFHTSDIFHEEDGE